MRSFYADDLDRVRAYQETPAYQKALRKRSVWVEPRFGEAKQWHGLRRFRLRRLPKVNTEALLTATGQNLKRLLRARGWGRRPWPGCPAGACRARRRRVALSTASAASCLPTAAAFRTTQQHDQNRSQIGPRARHRSGSRRRR